MKLASRILIALFAVLAAIAWCLLPIVFAQLANGMRGMSDGAASGPDSVPIPTLLLWGAIWLVPMAAFVLMFLTAINVLKGALRRIAYWYALIFLLIAGVILMGMFPLYYRAVKWTGLAFLLTAGLWVFAFRKNVEPKPSAVV